MPLTFHTKHLNHRLYRNMFWNLCLHTDFSPNEYLTKWDIHLFPLDGTDLAFFGHVDSTSGKLNPNMPSGVTGKHEMKLWLHDNTNDFMNRENSDRVQHEFCHSRLYEEYGTANQTWVRGVHEEDDWFKITFWYRSRFLLWKKFHLSIIDIRGLL
jgi:hypothetical protein